MRNNEIGYFVARDIAGGDPCDVGSRSVIDRRLEGSVAVTQKNGDQSPGPIVQAVVAMFAKARSGMPSPFKSATVHSLGTPPAEKSVPA